ncbi:MAG: Clp1/GlmU family protein, partial [Acidilobaceae archaeon]
SGEYERLDSLASEISRYGRVVFVGPVDSGKSTLAFWVSNKVFLRGSRAWYLTVDVGQNEVFCPGFEAIAAVEPPGIPGFTRSFSFVEPCFIGSFTPSDSLDKYLGCASRLSRIAQGHLVVDTDGWITPPGGLESKARLADAVNADLIVAIGLGEGEVRALRGTSIEVLSLPRLVKGSKSFEERRLHRERLLAQKLSGSKPRPVKLGETVVDGAPVFAGSPLEKTLFKSIAPNIVYAERTGEGSMTIVYRGRPPSNIEAKLIPQGWEKGLIAAVHGEGVHLGVIDKVNYETKTITIITPYQGPIRKIEMGKVKIDVETLTGKAKW